ncbi:MAG: CrcB family protein [Alcaligenaceae bacterium]|nr:CrcB family protein [Alcaligenaceae bacterium]
MWVHALCIAFGAGIGALVRWQLALITPVPWGTLLANIMGGLLIGFVVALIEAWTLPLWTRSMLVTGFLGGVDHV